MGETIDVNVADLLSVLARRGHSGRLAISLDGEEIQLFIERGRIASVTTSSHGLRIGRTLVRLGMLDAERLETAVHDQEVADVGRPLGEILIDHGWITREDLARGAEEQCIEALTRVIVADQGTFMFSRDAASRSTAALVALNTDGIVLEAARRADEMMTLRSLLPPPGATLMLANPTPAPMSSLAGVESRVAGSLQHGSATIAEIGRRVDIDDVTLWRAIISLRERGFLVARTGELMYPGTGSDDRVPDRTVDEIEELGRAAANGLPAPPMPSLAEIRAGAPASTQTVAALTLIVREVIAAFNAGLPLRAFAHFSDDHFRRQGTLSPEDSAALAAPAHPLPPEEQETVLAVRDVRQLLDGRASAILISHYPSVGETRKVLVFTRLEGRWQIDAVVESPRTKA